ncbi:MAG: hypothetical protein J6U37_03050 [Lachnospiraceae bacterium]|nr:hypothetical protein [Lachnospiraceae bacterium]
MKFLKNHWYDLVLFFACAVLILCNVFFLQNWIDADMSAEMVFSKLLSDEGAFLASKNWFYSTEFRILYSQIVMVPLFKFMTNWYAVRFIMNVVFYACMLASYFYMMKPLNLKRKHVVISATVLMLPFSETVMAHVFMGNTYMSHIIIVFLIMGLFLRLSFDSGKRKPFLETLNWAFYAFLVTVAGMSGVRYFLAILGPLVIAALIYGIVNKEFQVYRATPSKDTFKTLITSESAKPLYVSIVGAILGFLGYVVNVVYISHAFQFQTYEGIKFIQVYDGELMDRIQRTIGSFLMLFGYIDNKSVLSVRGIITVISFVIPALLILAAVLTKRSANAKITMLRIFFFVTLFVNTFAFVFTDSTVVARYYITVMIFTLPLLAAYLEYGRLSFDKTALITVLLLCLSLASLKEIGSMAGSDKNAGRREVSKFLTESGYEFGFATYWNAGIMTELSDGKLEVAGVYEPDMSEFKWSAPAKYYEDDYTSGPVFFIFSCEEAEKDKNAALIAAGDLVFENSDFKVYRYENKKAVTVFLNETN